MRGRFVARYTDPTDAFLPEAAQHPIFELVALPA